MKEKVCNTCLYQLDGDGGTLQRCAIASATMLKHIAKKVLPENKCDHKVFDPNPRK